MREKAKKFVYLDAENYVSFKFLKNFYWYVFILPLLMFVSGIYQINNGGVTCKSLFSLVSIAIWSLLYWGLVFTVSSNFVKKTFEIRFFVNGTFGIFISSLFWIFFANWNLIADKPFLHYNVFLWMIPIYLLVSIIFVVIVVICVHCDVFEKLMPSEKTITTLAVSIPSIAGLAFVVSRISRSMLSQTIQYAILAVGSIALIFVPILAHINFVKFFYCKKFNINCDVKGNNISKNLIPSNEGFLKRYKGLLIFIGIVVAFIAFSAIWGIIKGIMQKYF